MTDKDFDLVESATIPSAEQLVDPKSKESLVENGLQIKKYCVTVECEHERLADSGMEKSTDGDGMEDANKTRKKKRVKLEFPHGDVNLPPRVLRSTSAAVREDLERSDEHLASAKGKRKIDIKGKLSGVNPCDDVKSEVKHKHGESPEVEEVQAVDFKSKIKMKHKDIGSWDEDVNFVSHDIKKFTRKRGRPRKLQISSQSDDRCPSLKCESNQQSDIDVLNLRQRGRPPKTQKTVEGPNIREKNMKCNCGRTPKVLNQNLSDSVDESKIPKSNCRSRAKGSEPDGSRGRKKILRKRGRPPKLQKEMSLGETDNSAIEAKKGSKFNDGSSDSQAINPSVDSETRTGGRDSSQIEPGQQSRSGAKKLLRDRILQLLLAAGWKVEYRLRNGREYNDAVYVNPEGKTHWSVTLAYKVYKKHVESCMNDEKNSAVGSNFPLLSEEELHILERKSQKKRCDKGKKRSTLEDRDEAEDMVTMKKSGKQNLFAEKLPNERLRIQKLKLSTSCLARPFQKKLNGSNLSQYIECISPSRLSKSTKNKKREENHTRKRCALLAHSALEDADSKDDGFTLYEGKRTILGWMIDLGVVPLNGKVQCMNCIKTHVLLEGMISNEGILCDCCDEVFSLCDFEIHAGGKLNQPLESLYLEDGVSLLQCLLDSWNKQGKLQLNGFHFVDFSGGDPNDDTCGICGDGGDLVCCDGCPSTFHQSCLGIKKFPSGSWFCFYCSCKFCGEVKAASDDRTQSALLDCCLCEEKFHQECIGETGKTVNDRSNYSFCGKNCEELFEGLQLLIGVKQALPEGFSWSFLRRCNLSSKVSDVEVSDNIVCNSKLAVAFSVMDECFSPLVDHRSGINLLQNIVYSFGSNFNRLNYSGFLTAILERGDEIIAVASIRIHGNQLAEMPFIGTRYMYRRQGMCRRLMSGIESALGSLGVERLVIPAVPQLIETWISGFGFKPVDESSKKKTKNLNLMVFPGVDMLEKPLPKNNNAETNEPSCNGYPPLVHEMCQQVDAKANNGEGICSSKLELGLLGPETAGNAHGGNSDVESPIYSADSCTILGKNEHLEDEVEMGKVSDKALESRLELADSCTGDITKMQNMLDSEKRSDSLVIDGSHQDKTGDFEMSSPVCDGCILGTDVTMETNLQDGRDIKELSHSVTDGETEEESKSNALSSALQIQERSDCHHATIPSQTESRALENIVAEQKMHLFECPII